VNSASSFAIKWVENGLVPDIVIRRGIRRLCAERLRELRADESALACEHAEWFIDAMDISAIALEPDLANTQHYELPQELRLVRPA
jgi:cyclopropane-fatty-acyl-phospholipid synthase